MTTGEDSESTGEESSATCQVCGVAIEDEPLYCGSCGTPHHRDCWSYLGHCSTFACGCHHYVGEPKRAMPAYDVEVQAGTNDGEPTELAIDEQGRAWVGSTHVALPTVVRAPATIIDIGGWPLDIASRHTRLDLDTPLETFLQVTAATLCLLGAFLGVLLAPSFSWTYGAVLWPMALVLMFLRMFVECTYLLDNEARELLYSRSIFGWTSTWKICKFDDIERVGLVARYHQQDRANYYTYAVMLIIGSRLRVQVSDETRNFELASGMSKQLANHLGAAWSRPSQTVGVGGEEGTLPMTISDRNWRTVPWIGRANLIWSFFFFVLMVLNYMAFK